MEDLKDNIQTFDEFKKLTKEEYAIIDKVVNKIKESPVIECTKCNYCLDYCTINIIIPKFFELYNARKSLNKPDTLILYYKNLVSNNDARASNCVKCNMCVEHCPQSIDIPKELEKVVKLFESN